MRAKVSLTIALMGFFLLSLPCLAQEKVKELEETGFLQELYSRR